MYGGVGDSAVGAFFFRRVWGYGNWGSCALQHLSIIGQLVKHLARGKLAVVGMVAVNLARGLPILLALNH